MRALNVTAAFGQFEVRWSEQADGLVLACDLCGHKVCNIEHDDSLSALILTADAHKPNCNI